jgi:hypothetical protein
MNWPELYQTFSLEAIYLGNVEKRRTYTGQDLQYDGWR